jgi:serine/threonine-protein kinase ATR
MGMLFLNGCCDESLFDDRPNSLQRLRVLLEHITAGVAPGELSFPPAVMAHMFLDTRLSQQIAMIDPKLQPDEPLQRPAKKLRTSIESKALPELISAMEALIPVRRHSDGELAEPGDDVL